MSKFSRKKISIDIFRIVIPPQANAPPATVTGAQTTGNPIVITSGGSTITTIGYAATPASTSSTAGPTDTGTAQQETTSKGSLPLLFDSKGFRRTRRRRNWWYC